MLDKPLTRRERDNEINLLEGCINRICITDNEKELIRMIGSANYRISRLAESRSLELEAKKVDDFLNE